MTTRTLSIKLSAEDIIQAFPGAEVSCRGLNVIWHGPGLPPTVAKIESAHAALAGARALTALRTERDIRLAATDWRFMSDVIQSPAWAAYRQALRDLPGLTTDPANPPWPVAPAAGA